MKDKWFHIKALEPGINIVITFWLGADSKEDLDRILKKPPGYLPGGFYIVSYKYLFEQHQLLHGSI